jgi:NAD+ kinase
VRQTIGIFPNITKPGALDLSVKVLDWLQSRGYRGLLPPCAAGIAGRPDSGLPMSLWSSSMLFAVVLGGDGTLLSAARALCPRGISLLGVNLGHFGFLTELVEEDLFESLPCFLEGRAKLDERIALEASVIRDGYAVCRKMAVNEACIMKGPYGRMTVLGLSVSGTEVDTYHADGVIISTPTGSTAYSLSAGGPIVAPQVEALTVTPVCPHTLYSRSIVVPVTETCDVKVFVPSLSTILSIDGQEYFSLKSDDTVRVMASSVRVSLLRRPEWSFYEVMRKKMKEGADRLPR